MGARDLFIGYLYLETNALFHNVSTVFVGFAFIWGIFIGNTKIAKFGKINVFM